jgi:ribulose-bisphosphate carboxylase large chain
VEQLERGPVSGWHVTLSYDTSLVARELPQLLNLLFGNVSLKSGIRVASVDWPAALLRELGGPRFGVAGVRELCGVSERRPLLCAALKPVGSTAKQLARRAYDLAVGGMDLIKDDHGLTDQLAAPFAERVLRCREAVAMADRRTGRHTLYAPNVTGPADAVEQRAELAREAGCRIVLICPLLVGVDRLREIGRRYDLAVLAHPALAGAFFRPDHGIAPEVLLGQIFRIAGGDGVIFPYAGGRFPLSRETCGAIHRRLREPLGSVRPSFPVPAGGIALERARQWVERLGPDTVLLVGGSLYARGDLVGAAAALRESVLGAPTDGDRATNNP